LVLEREYRTEAVIADENYQRQDLGSFGVEYVRSSLEAGRSLSKEVGGTVDLSSGIVVTNLPTRLINLSPQTFRSGGVASARVSEGLVEARIRQYLVAGHDVLIGENLLASCSDLWIRKRPVGVICYVNEVYHLGRRDGADSTSIAGALRAAHLVPDGQVSIVTTWKEELPTAWPHPVFDLRPLAASVKAIIVSAFDGEGYVVWEPEQATSAA
jgi:hypothetical protein